MVRGAASGLDALAAQPGCGATCWTAATLLTNPATPHACSLFVATWLLCISLRAEALHAARGGGEAVSRRQ